MILAQISAQALSLASARLAEIVKGKSAMPLLAGVRRDVVRTPVGGQIRFSANDLEIAATSTHPAEVQREGRVCVSAKMLAQIAAKVPENVVELRELPNGWVDVTSGASLFSLPGGEQEEFPEAPAVD